MTGTAYAGYWDQFVPKQFIVQGFREDVLTWLINRQKRLIEKFDIDDPRVAAFIILDDVIGDQKQMRWTASLNDFFVQGRHLALQVHICSQYVKGVGRKFFFSVKNIL